SVRDLAVDVDTLRRRRPAESKHDTGEEGDELHCLIRTLKFVGPRRRVGETGGARISECGEAKSALLDRLGKICRPSRIFADHRIGDFDALISRLSDGLENAVDRSLPVLAEHLPRVSLTTDSEHCPTLPSGHLVSSEQLLEELDAVAGEPVRGGSHGTPDAGAVGEIDDIGIEAFYDDRAVVFDCLQRVAHFRPVDLSGARGAAVVLAGMEMLQMPTCMSDRLALVFLFDRHMERVEKDADGAAADILSKADRLFRLVHEVGFETVQRLERNGHALQLGGLADLAERADRPFPFARTLVRWHIAGTKELGVERP